MAVTMARYRIRVDLFLNFFIAPFLKRRKAASRTKPTERPNHDEMIHAVVRAAETETRDEFRVHAATAAFRLLLEEINDINGGIRGRFSEDLMTYFLPKFLEIVLLGHSYVVTDEKTDESGMKRIERTPKELDLYKIFNLQALTGKAPDTTLFNRLKAVALIRQEKEKREAIGEKVSIETICGDLAERFIQEQQDSEIAIAADESSLQTDRDVSTKEHQDLARTEKVKKGWHYTQETLLKYHSDFSGVMDDITSHDFFAWETDLESEYRILKKRLDKLDGKVKELHSGN